MTEEVEHKDKQQKMTEAEEVIEVEATGHDMPKPLHQQLYEAIDKNDIQTLESVLKQYPDKKFYPSLNDTVVRSFEALKMLKKYYDTYFDVDLYHNILKIADTTKTHESLREYTQFLINNGFNFRKDSEDDGDYRSYFDLLVDKMELTMATEVLKYSETVKFFIQVDAHKYRYLISERWNVHKEEHYPIYLGFIEECMKAGLLFPEGTKFKYKKFEEVVKKYPKEEIKVIKYNC